MKQSTTLLALLGTLTLSHTALGMDIIPSNSNYYYKLGGGSDISMPPVTTDRRITIGGDVNTNLGYTCGFNPAVSIRNMFNSNMLGSVQDIGQDILGSLTSSMTTFPLYLLEKTDKNLYNLLQNGISSGENSFNIHMGDCQHALSNISKGKSPTQDWFSISDSQGWMQHAKEKDADIQSASKQITKDPKKYGIPWVHKGVNSGGSTGNQVPIKVIYDVVVAGYNTMVDTQNPLDATSTPADPNSGLGRYWKTANDAGNWSRLVLGDVTITAHDDQDNTSRGVGLMTIVQTCPEHATNDLTCAKTIQQNLSQIVQSNGYPQAEELKRVSSNEMMITPQIINAIRNKDKQSQAIAISKLSQDVAIQNVVDEGLMMRRVLIAGSQTKPVHNLKPAMTAVNTAVSQLHTDINDVLFQFQVKKQLMTSTAEIIMSDESQAQASAMSQRTETQAPNIENGAVYKSN